MNKTKKISFQFDDLPTADKELEAEYEVEKVVDSRITAEGKREYFIKWKGYNDYDNSWESDVDCPELIREFEEERVRRKASGIPLVYGFDRGRRPEKIVGVTDTAGKYLNNSQHLL